MEQETKIIKGYTQLEEVMESIEGTKRGLWLTCPLRSRYVYLTLKRVPVVNVGLAEHRFNSLEKSSISLRNKINRFCKFSEAINYILEFLYN